MSERKQVMKKRTAYRIFLLVTAVLVMIKSFFFPDQVIFGTVVACVIFLFLITTALIMITDPHMFEYDRDDPRRIERLPKIGWFLIFVTVLLISGYVLWMVRFR